MMMMNQPAIEVMWKRGKHQTKSNNTPDEGRHGGFGSEDQGTCILWKCVVEWLRPGGEEGKGGMEGRRKKRREGRKKRNFQVPVTVTLLWPLPFLDFGTAQRTNAILLYLRNRLLIARKPSA